MARRISVEIVGNAASLERSFKRAEHTTRGFNSTIGSLRIGIGSLAKSVVVVAAVEKALEGIAATVHAGTHEFSENARITAQTQAVLKSTGSVAGVTAGHVEDLGLKLSNLSGIDDEVVRAGANVLLSFTHIRDQVGKGNDIFTQATKAATDWAVRTGKDLPQAAQLLGRSLEDPARKAASLARAGIVFSQAQLKQIKAWEVGGNVLKAQKFILAEIEKRFGGAAAAAGKTLPGQLAILHDRFKDLAGTVVGLFAPSVSKGATALTGFVRKLSETHGASGKLGVLADGLKSTARGLVRVWRFELSKIGDVDWDAVGAKLRNGLGAIRDRLAAVNWRGVAHDIGTRIGQALSGLADVISRVNWSAVGAAMVRGVAMAVGAVAVFLAHVDWGAIIKGSFRLLVAVLRGTGSLLLGAGKELGMMLVHGIGAGLAALGQVIKAKLDAAFSKLEELAIKTVLHIIEPFSHLPFGMGKWAQDMKDRLHTQLQAMQQDARQTAAVIHAALAPLTPEQRSETRREENRASAISGGRSAKGAGSGRGAAGSVNTGLGLGGGGGTTKAAKGFKLPFALQLEQAQADASGAQSQIVKAARDIRAFLLKVMPKLKGQKLLDAYGLLGQANSTIASAMQAAAAKAKDAATKARDAAKRAAEKLKQAMDAMRQKFAAALDNVRSQIGELFQGPVLAPTDAQRKAQLGVPGPDPAKLLADLRAQTGQFVRLQRDLAALSKRGAPKRLVTELNAKGVAAIPQIEALLGGPKSVLQQFFKAFQQRERVAIRTARMDVTASRVVIGSGTKQPIEVTVNLDGQTVAKVVTKHQDRNKRTQASSRRGR